MQSSEIYDKTLMREKTPFQALLSCVVTILSVVILCGFCYFVIFSSPKKGSAGEKALGFVTELGEESSQCLNDFRQDYSVVFTKGFAFKCYKNPFVLWSGVVCFSVFSSIFFMI